MFGPEKLRHSVKTGAAAALLLLGGTHLSAQPPAASEQTTLPSPSTWPALTLMAETGSRRFSRDQQGVFNGITLAYRVTLEEAILKDRDGKPATSIFTTSFVANETKSRASRPVVFVFNGGPGGASNVLLFGAFGPKRLRSFTSAAQADPATPLVNNPWSILDATDLVFIDPPETGFGRPLPGTDPKIFRSNDGDSYAVGQFILHWLHENKRFGSPVYIAGESYGSLRAVMLARDLLAATPRVQVNGLLLISQAIYYNGPASFGLKRIPDPMRAITRLHDVTALAWYHGLIDNRGQTLEQAIGAARQFEQTGYATALIKGNRLTETERKDIAKDLAKHTGLPDSYFLANNLRVQNLRHDLLVARGLALGQFDGRETEALQSAVADEDRDWEKAVLGLTRAMERYAAGTLGAKTLPAYRTIVPDPYGFEKTWQYIAPPNPGLDVVLEEQMRANPKLRVMVPQGVFDTTSSMGATEALFAQMAVPRDRVTITYYPGGHMLYSDIEGMKAFNADVRAFVRGDSLTGRPFPRPHPGRAQ
jgi:carboxypeptidase C (cathepsin A)